MSDTIFRDSVISDDPREWNFVMKCWKNTAAADWARREGHPSIDAVKRVIEAGIERLRSRGAEFRCIRNVQEDSQIFAFSCVEDDIGHFVYTKDWFRKRGLARELLRGVKYATFCPSNKERFLKRLNIRRIDL